MFCSYPLSLMYSSANSPSFVTNSQAENSKTLETLAKIVFNIRKAKLFVVKEFPLARFLSDKYSFNRDNLKTFIYLML